MKKLRLKNTPFIFIFVEFLDVSHDLMLIRGWLGDLVVQSTDMTEVTTKEAMQEFFFSIYRENINWKNFTILHCGAILLFILLTILL